MEAGPIRASSTNIERCAKQIDSKDIFILSGRLKSLSSKTTAVNQAQELFNWQVHAGRYLPCVAYNLTKTGVFSVQWE